MADKVEQQDIEVEVVQEAETAQVKESENKEHHEDNPGNYSPDVVVVEQPISGPTSFADLEAKQQAMENAAQVQDLSMQFQMMTRNIMGDPTVEDKGVAVQTLSAEFAERVDTTMEQKELEVKADERLTKEQHYKEVAHDDKQVVESDFQGGCQTCRFGESDILKELANCPYCWNELEVSHDA